MNERITLPLNNLLRVKTLDFIRQANQLKSFYNLLENQYHVSKQEIEEYQNGQLRKIFLYHYNNNTAYKKFLDKHDFKMSENFDIRDVPFVTKEFFRQNNDICFNEKEVFLVKHSGGSTGSPLKVYLSKKAVENFWPSIWRAFAVSGILPCERIMMIAGPSLFNNRTIKRRIYDWINRFTVISAFDLNDELMQKAYEIMLKKDIKAIYGYTSSILEFLRFMQRNNLQLNLKAIFSTSETFMPSIRNLARIYCGCDVFDTYGANDGGVQAFECEVHNGYHINFERCFVEIINGEIVLTDLLNTAAPFIRYRVGDYTTSQNLIKEKCTCGRTLFRIENISGRVNQFIEDIDSNKIHTEFFSHIFSADSHIIQYQIVQKGNEISINIIHDDEKDEKSFIDKYSPLVSLRFKMPFKFVFNQEVRKLSNMKTPILIVEEVN